MWNESNRGIIAALFSLSVILVMPQTSRRDPRRWCDLMLFLMGFLVPGLIGAAIGYFLLSEPIPNLFDNISEVTILYPRLLGSFKASFYIM